MPILNFSSGKQQTIYPSELQNFIIKLKNGGIRVAKLVNGSYIMLNSNTMEFIDCSDQEEKEQFPTPVVESTSSIDSGLSAVEVNPPGMAERERDALAEMIAKSNCVHTNTVLYKSIGKKGDRYFYVCEFCGKRERFVSSDTLSEDEKEKALVYHEK
jgi:hypothetical protein